MATQGSIAGRWHLIDATDDEQNLPPHRVDLVLHEEGTGFRGEILSRLDANPIPLRSVTFDGVELRLQMAPRPGGTPRNMPFLVMARIGDRFEGGWTTPGTEHIRLKLVRG